MKKPRSEIYIKQILPLTLLLTSSLCIWFLGPLIIIGNHAPLYSPEKRFYLIILVYLLWLLKILFIDALFDETATLQTIPPETQKKEELLQQRFNGILEFLKSKSNLRTLPWYLFIGPTQGGKTTLLAHAGIHYILSKQFHDSREIIPSQNCEWWVHRNAIIVDVPSSYFSTKDLQHIESSILWEKLLTLFASSKEQIPTPGILIALNLPELFNIHKKQEKSQLVQHLKARLLELKKKFGNTLAIQLVITKCDLLPGFLAFFNESSTEELTQPWGISLPFSKKESTIDNFTERFNTLIKRLNKQVIWRLHQERDPHLRPLIKDFPQHIERLKESLVSLLKTFVTTDIWLQGVYLTSATQTHDEENFLHIHNTNALSQNSPRLAEVPRTPPHPYFIKQFLLQALAKSNSADKRPYSIKNALIYVSSVGIVLTAIAFLGSNFYVSMQKTLLLQLKLTHYQQAIQHADPNQGTIDVTLKLLDELQNITRASQNTFPYLKHFNFYSNRTQQTADVIYNEAVYTILLSQIKNHFENFLQNLDDKNPKKIYAVLKAYLMLGNTRTIKIHEIFPIINQTLQIPLETKNINAIIHHLEIVLQRSPRTITLNRALIFNARKKLISVPTIDLANIILDNMNENGANSAILLGTNSGNPPIFVSDNIDNQIPNMFVASRFQEITANDIPTAASEALRGNKILGMIKPTANQPSLAALLVQLHSQYITQYIDVWESLIANIRPYSPKNLTQINDMITTLTSNRSPLLQLLKTIHQNTGFSAVYTNSSKLQALNNLFAKTNSHESLLYQIFISLRELHNYLSNIINSQNITEAATTAANLRINKPIKNPITEVEKIADQSPEPIKTWLHKIAQQSWGYIMVTANMDNSNLQS